MIKYKLVLLDMDGTMLNEDKKIPKENIEVIKALREMGIIVVLASGKPYDNLEMYSNMCGAGPYVIGSNGAIIRDIEKNEDIFAKKVEKKYALKVLEKAKKYGFWIMVNIGGRLITEEEKYGLTNANRSEISVVSDIKEYLETSKKDEPILKITYLHEDKEKLELLREELSDIEEVSVKKVGKATFAKLENETDNYPYYLDIMDLNITKAEAVETLRKKLNIDKSETIAIGDGLNDLEMLQSVGFAVAMGNAEPEVKAIAHMITASNDDVGVAKALTELFLEKKEILQK